MEGKILELEHQPGGEWVLRFHLPKGKLPLHGETKEHVLKAHKEILLALRSLLDIAIEKTEKAEERKPQKRAKIPVQ